MFATLKNKIKEETGSDVTHCLSNPNNNNNNRNVRSRFSSTISINSTNDELGDQQCYNNTSSEQLSLARSQCNELTTKLTDITARLNAVQEEKLRVEKTNEILLESVKVAQTQKELYCAEQEKIQNMLQNEIDKIKSLLSFREQEALNHLCTMRQQQDQIELLSTELERLKQYEHITDDLQAKLETEANSLRIRLNAAEERFSEYATNAENIAETMRQQNTDLLKQLNDQQVMLELEKEEKLTALLKNAEISQSEEILRKELRIERDEANELHEKYLKLQTETKAKQQELADLKLEMDELRNVLLKSEEKLKAIEELHTDINEKNKTIKMLNQHVSDLKKTLQTEFNNSKYFDANTNSFKASSNGYVTAQTTTTSHCPNCNQTNKIPSLSMLSSDSIGSGIVMDEVNFKYLKHVIVKFLTSREVEARHLIRAVSTLLKLSSEEEKLLHDTLNWKMSWFGSKPDHGTGQRKFSIPPS